MRDSDYAYSNGIYGRGLTKREWYAGLAMHALLAGLGDDAKYDLLFGNDSALRSRIVNMASAIGSEMTAKLGGVE